ncbi:MAG TPA: hypothetical protein VNP04_20420 [Alphaproteobacteria bacterium]|nr:hypothetical protein [Alphaproteobacteria bacterium]
MPVLGITTWFEWLAGGDPCKSVLVIATPPKAGKFNVDIGDFRDMWPSTPIGSSIENLHFGRLSEWLKELHCGGTICMNGKDTALHHDLIPRSLIAEEFQLGCRVPLQWISWNEQYIDCEEQGDAEDNDHDGVRASKLEGIR